MAPQSIGCTYCYYYSTLAGLLEHYERQKIPEGFNMNNIRRSLVKERALLPPNKKSKVFNVINIKGYINVLGCDETQINTNINIEKGGQNKFNI
ncbi:MAG: hypothetical protein DRP89_05290 [Candidatus Neomarinimicrobiota bacterium]|nr:MAG: hypothetical protein DRP89_05290 [Candidatus Neomarinimicrobiota bacterium]